MVSGHRHDLLFIDPEMLTMNITTRNGNNCTVLDLNGRLVPGMDLVELRNAVQSAAWKNPAKIILNLARVTYVDVGGINELVKTFSYIKNQGGRLVLTNLPRRVRFLLDTARLTDVLQVVDSIQAEG